MIFVPKNFAPIGTGYGESCAQQMFTYVCMISSIEQITADGFFPTNLLLKMGDLIFIPVVGNPLSASSMYVVMITEPLGIAQGGRYEGVVKSKVIIDTSAGGGGVPADDSITTAMLQDECVSTAKLEDDCVATGKIADSAVTYAKLSSDITGITTGHSGPATAATSTAFTVAGVDATNVAIAFMTAGFSQPIVGTVCTADTVTVHFAAAALVTDTVEILVIGNHNS